MKCFNHEDRDAVATCQVCGKGLCKECASKHTPCMCDECYERLQEEKREEEQRALAEEQERKEQAEAREKQALIDAEKWKQKQKSDALVDTWKEFLGAAGKGILGIFVAYFVLSLLMKDSSEDSITLMAVMFGFGLPFGWQLLTWFKEEIFDIGAIADWLLEFCYILGPIGAFIGWMIKILVFSVECTIAIFVGWIYFVFIVIKFIVSQAKILLSK